MVYRLLQPQPQRGSTEWGARQFYRLLDDEERVATERERLLAMGWRPPETGFPAPDRGPVAQEPAFGDDRDAYADLIERDLALRRTLENEAQRRSTTMPSSAPPTLPISRVPEPLPRRAGGGRFATAIPRSRPNLIPAFAETPNTQDELFDPIIRRSGGGRGSLVAAFIAIAQILSHLMFQSPRTREEQEALNRKIEAAQFAYRRLTHQMAAQFSREELERIKADSGVDFDIIERELPAPPANSDLGEGRQSVRPEADDGDVAIRPWIPFISRDMPDDDEDYCYRRWQAERRRCRRWPQKWLNGCLERANNRHMLCVGNDGTPHPREPSEWSEEDMERWYNPYR